MRTITLSELGFLGEALMEDLLWIGVVLGLLAVTLGYVRLCDNA